MRTDEVFYDWILRDQATCWILIFTRREQKKQAEENQALVICRKHTADPEKDFKAQTKSLKLKKLKNSSTLTMCRKHWENAQEETHAQTAFMLNGWLSKGTKESRKNQVENAVISTTRRKHWDTIDDIL